jgi:hypothetical protein
MNTLAAMAMRFDDVTSSACGAFDEAFTRPLRGFSRPFVGLNGAILDTLAAHQAHCGRGYAKVSGRVRL